jgi:hypothetical protein
MLLVAVRLDPVVAQVVVLEYGKGRHLPTIRLLRYILLLVLLPARRPIYP